MHTKQVPRDHWPVPAIHVVLAGAKRLQQMFDHTTWPPYDPVSYKKSKPRYDSVRVKSTFVNMDADPLHSMLRGPWYGAVYSNNP